MLTLNNRLIGRCILGPGILLERFYRHEFKRLQNCDPGVGQAWLAHAFGLAPPILWLALACDLNPAVYAPTSAYLGLSVLMIRTFAENQADVDPRGRTVVIEDRSPLSLLFLNNNLHASHHAFPGAPWYRLPQLLEIHRSGFLGSADAYHFRGYRDLLGGYALRLKEPVAHPHLRRDPP